MPLKHLKLLIRVGWLSSPQAVHKAGGEGGGGRVKSSAPADDLTELVAVPRVSRDRIQMRRINKAYMIFKTQR